MRLPLAWPLLLAIVGLEAVWAFAINLSITEWAQFAFEALLFMVVGAFCRASSRWPRIGEMADAVGTWLVFTAVACVLTYLSARSTLPLRDAAFVRLDQVIGFDWMGWNRWVGEHPALRTVLHWAYGSLHTQVFFSCCLLPLTGDARRSSELFWAALVSIVVTCAVSGALPAVGAFQHYGLYAQAIWDADLSALRQDGAVTFVLLQMNGIVSFPSYHAVLAVLFIYSHRRTGIVGAVVAVLNFVMLVSTPSEGGHYLTDVLAGVGVALVSIAVVRNARGMWLGVCGRSDGAAWGGSQKPDATLIRLHGHDAKQQFAAIGVAEAD